MTPELPSSNQARMVRHVTLPLPFAGASDMERARGIFGGFRMPNSDGRAGSKLFELLRRESDLTHP